MMRLRRLVEISLFVAGFACTGYWAVQSADALLPPKNPLPAAFDGPARMEVPALHLSVPMVEGADEASLKHGVGHIVGTAMPGGLGTIGLAGHRDTYLRPLRKIARGMEIDLIDARGTFRYVVRSMEIVAPDRNEVLNISTAPELSLITCYPFDYVGPAPRRFVVHARLVSAAPQ